MNTEIEAFNQAVRDFFGAPFSYQSIIVLIVAIVIAYWFSRILGQGFIKLAQILAVRADNAPSEERIFRLRRIETYLSVTVALIRALVIAVVTYLVWKLLYPHGSETLATIGAGTLFVVLASGTISSLLKDVTAGATMIIENWFTIGDYIQVEPFNNLSGIVERATLRSTQLRSLNGEVIWLHNQQIQAVRVTPRGLRTMAVDIFVNDQKLGEKAVEKLIATIPTGATMLARPLKIADSERWANNLWRITVTGQTTPGREWLIDKYFVDGVKAIDDGKAKKEKLVVLEPIARFADPVAEKKFQRTVRVKKK